MKKHLTRKKINSFTQEEWARISTCIASDILESKITLSSNMLSQIFIGPDEISSEDLLFTLIKPYTTDWETYLLEALEDSKSWDEELKLLHRPLRAKEKTLFCRVCDFEASQGEFTWNEVDESFSCPECSSLALGVRRNIEEE